jgi:hypothetical protein
VRRHDRLNGLRLSDYEARFAAHGFETEVVVRARLSTTTRSRGIHLTPRFRRYAEDDLRCRRAVIVARKTTCDRSAGRGTNSQRFLDFCASDRQDMGCL